MARSKRGYRTFQTDGCIPGTKISYYAEHPIAEVGILIKKTKHYRKKKRG